jgi:hypothetical protein
MPAPTAPTLIRVKVKPNARESSLEQLADGSWEPRAGVTGGNGARGPRGAVTQG